MKQEPAATAAAEPTSQYVQVNRLRLHYFEWGGDAALRILCYATAAPRMLIGGTTSRRNLFHMAG